MKVEEKNGRKIAKKVFGRRFCLFSGFRGRVFKKLSKKSSKKCSKKFPKFSPQFWPVHFMSELCPDTKVRAFLLSEIWSTAAVIWVVFNWRKKQPKSRKISFRSPFVSFFGFFGAGLSKKFWKKSSKKFSKKFWCRSDEKSAFDLVARISPHYMLLYNSWYM